MEVDEDLAARPVGPEGSAYDGANERRRSRGMKRRVLGWLSWRMVGLIAATFPYAYYAYCWLVWRTARRHVDGLNGPITAALARHGRVVSLMWHEEVFSSAFAYGPLRGSALASTSNFGRIITRMLEVCGCDVYRGGSSKGSRGRKVLPDMIRHMSSVPRCLYGLTVDGSKGPAYRMKSGGLVIARDCRAPIYLVRTWSSPAVRLRTWDRSAIPLPFGRMYQGVVGPFWIAPETTDEELLAIRDHLERELLELADHSLRSMEGPTAPPRPRRGFPEGFAARWPAGQIGLPLGPHDLRPDAPPAWATTPDAPHTWAATPAA